MHILPGRRGGGPGTSRPVRLRLPAQAKGTSENRLMEELATAAGTGAAGLEREKRAAGVRRFAVRRPMEPEPRVAEVSVARGGCGR
jgi:hypothetical protein